MNSSPSIAGTMQFQSTPAPIGAGDQHAVAVDVERERFNPRPPQSERATRCGVAVGQGPSVSIHARPNRSGRRLTYPVAADINIVSIHARPNRSGRHRGAMRVTGLRHVSIHARPNRSGRQGTRRAPTHCWSFQSTPAPIGAGDRPTGPWAANQRSFNPRPPQSERATTLSPPL